jgi:hypothetical protein
MKEWRPRMEIAVIRDMTKKRGRKPIAKKDRKDQLVQTRVPGELSETLREAARQKRVTVSQLIRNVLEDTFNLVDDVVGASVSLGQTVRRDAMRIAESAKGRVKRPPAGEPDPLAHIEAWQQVLVNTEVVCAQCARIVKKGEQGAFGIGPDPSSPKVWLCSSCAARL